MKWTILCLALYYFLQCHAQELEEVLGRAAGIYKDPKKQIGLEKTVFVTGCNYGFINHLHNFKCFADRLGLKFLVASLDLQTHEYISNQTDMYSYLMTGVANSIGSAATEFRSKQFNLITAKKKEVVHDILVLGYDVLFSDTDVALVRDPIPHLLWEGVDYVHTVNTVCTE